MTDAAPKKISLWREAWGEFRRSFSESWPWLLALAATLAVLYFFFNAPADTGITADLQRDPHLLREHPELMRPYMREIVVRSLWMVPLFLVVFPLGYYVFTLRYLRAVMVRDRPDYSVNGFFYWYGKTAWKYLRPVLWCLIPVIGGVFYLRSLMRYQVVSPLALLKRGQELKTSWDMTRGNWWRIFGNYLLIVLLLVIIFVLLFVALFVLGALIAYGIGPTALLGRLVTCMAQAAWVALGMQAYSVYTCVVYKTLLRETGRPDEALFAPVNLVV